jgi:hypothetical protein
VTAAETMAIADRLRGPRRVVGFPGVGHDMPFVWHAPEQWGQAVAEFLAQVPPAAE